MEQTIQQLQSDNEQLEKDKQNLLIRLKTLLEYD